MTKIFISQPFSGRTEEEIFEERERIVHILTRHSHEEVEVINQYHQTKPEGAGRFYYLSQDILMMDEADIIIFAPGWRKAKGCRVEHELAEAYGLNYMEIWERWGGEV